MARQRGVVKLEGAIDDIAFTKTRNGFRAGFKSAVKKERILSDPAYARTRENMSEFAKAGKGGKVLRKSLRNLLQQCKDRALTARMLRSFMAVVKADATSMRGERNVMDGETELLKGFEFNVNATLEFNFFAPWTAVIDRAAGTGTVTLAPFIPVTQIIAPEGATHFKVASALSAVNFETESFETDEHETAILPLDQNATAAINHVNAVSAASTHPLFLAMGVMFYQRVNGVDYPLKNGAFNALSLVAVDGG